ncbi:hypothetical protein ACQPYK_29375 [Streptosporangium sp. CA-135522]|uniref:hypothetical protein n=1 Tax=Streptosporangium sp. CA-135522 TaxID=3240072 RepID=UPI003D923DB9
MDPVADMGIGQGRVRFPEPHLLGAADGVNRLHGVDAVEAMVRARCEAGLNARGLSGDRAALQRLEEELAVIARLGYAPYVLTVAEITDMIRGMGVRVAARGSAAGGLVTYVLGVSKVDPLRHGPLMERFLSTRRRSLGSR